MQKKKVHKGYLLAGPFICNYKLELPFAIRNNLSGSPVFFYPFFFLNCGWMVLNQNPMEIPSEPVRKERICQNLIRSLGGECRFLVYICKSDPIPQKMREPFTIADATFFPKYIPIIPYLIALEIIYFCSSWCRASSAPRSPSAPWPWGRAAILAATPAENHGGRDGFNGLARKF